MPVLYNSKKLIPVQSIGIDKEYVNGESGQFRKCQYVVTCNGTLVAYKGSPDGDGNFWTSSGYPPDTDPVIANESDHRLALLRNKMGALDDLFCEKGFFFEVQPFDGTASIRFIPRVRNISYSPGAAGSADWHTKINYTITMETDKIDFGSFSLCANEEAENDFEETWTIEPSDERGRTYKVVHNLSAQAKDKYEDAGTGILEKKGWIVARDRVLSKLGFDLNTTGTGVPAPDHMTVDGLSSYSSRYNYIKNENIDETNGRYNVTENWLLYDSADKYIEEYTVSTKTVAETQLVSVNINGTITGFNTLVTPGIGDRFANAETGWATIQSILITRAQLYSGVTLNANLVGRSVGKNVLGGTITYDFEYTNKPSSSISGAITENVVVTDQLPIEVIAKHVCVLRTVGPVLQDILTVTESRRSLSIDIQMPARTQSFTPTKPDVTSIILEHIPVATYQGPYVDRNEFTWDSYSGRYTRNISWIWV